MVSRLPWFKVQCRLVDHPKFQSLSAAHKGYLLILWCLSYDNEPRGKLPESKRCIRYLGSAFVVNPNRFPVLIDSLILKGFFDRGEDGIWIHDFQYWQSKPGESERVDFQQDFNNVSTIFQLSVDSAAENKGLNPQNDLPREKDRKKRGSRCSPPSKITGSKRQKATMDLRYTPLKEHITREWLQWRKCSISSVTTAKDWSQLAAMLKRSNGDPACSLEALKAAFTRFAASNSNFDKRQGLAYWSTNLQAFLNKKSLSLPIGYRKADSSRQVVIDDLDDLEWWKKAKTKEE